MVVCGCLNAVSAPLEAGLPVHSTAYALSLGASTPDSTKAHDGIREIALINFGQRESSYRRVVSVVVHRRDRGQTGGVKDVCLVCSSWARSS